MTAIAVGATTATISAKTPAATKVSAGTKGFFARAYAAFVEARMRQAEREIAMHRHLLPGQLQMAGERLAARSEKNLPFSR